MCLHRQPAGQPEEASSGCEASRRSLECKLYQQCQPVMVGFAVMNSGAGRQSLGWQGA